LKKDKTNLQEVVWNLMFVNPPSVKVQAGENECSGSDITHSKSASVPTATDGWGHCSNMHLTVLTN